MPVYVPCITCALRDVIDIKGVTVVSINREAHHEFGMRAGTSLCPSMK